MNKLKLSQTSSTNTWLAQNEDVLESPVFVFCHEQSAGRGQRGNSWEAEPGKNLTGSFLFHPVDFRAACQFTLSEMTALSVVSLLKYYGIHAKVKWPNDIYVDDKKICGILVEHVVTGQNVTRTIAGVGLNINQEIFLSDAPNPVSMKQITRQEYSVEIIVDRLVEIFESYLNLISEPEKVHSEFMENLWRNDGLFHPFHDKLTDELIFGMIDSVSKEGFLKLITREGKTRRYAFKEVEFLLNT